MCDISITHDGMISYGMYIISPIKMLSIEFDILIIHIKGQICPSSESPLSRIFHTVVPYLFSVGVEK